MIEPWHIIWWLGTSALQKIDAAPMTQNPLTLAHYFMEPCDLVAKDKRHYLYSVHNYNFWPTIASEI